MGSEREVVPSDLGMVPIVSPGVLISHRTGCKERDVADEIREETSRVEHDKVEREPLDRVAPPVDEKLGVERDGPRGGVRDS